MLLTKENSEGFTFRLSKKFLKKMIHFLQWLIYIVEIVIKYECRNSINF